MTDTGPSEAEVDAAAIAIQAVKINGQRQRFTDDYATELARAALQAAAAVREKELHDG